jgi:hypothetical protein
MSCEQQTNTQQTRRCRPSSCNMQIHLLSLSHAVMPCRTATIPAAAAVVVAAAVAPLGRSLPVLLSPLLLLLPQCCYPLCCCCCPSAACQRDTSPAPAVPHYHICWGPLTWGGAHSPDQGLMRYPASQTTHHAALALLDWIGLLNQLCQTTAKLHAPLQPS